MINKESLLLTKKTDETRKTVSRTNIFFFFITFLAITAYITRITELLPILGTLRINLFLLVITCILFCFLGFVKKLSLQKNSELTMSILWLALCLASVPFSVWPHKAFFTTSETVLINTFIFLLVQSIIQSEKELFGVTKIFPVSAGILILGMFFNPVIVEGNRLTTTRSYDPNDIAMFFVFSFPLILFLFIRARKPGKVFFAGILVLLVLAISKTGSRGGLLALGISVAISLFSRPLQIHFSYKILVVIMFLAALFSSGGEVLRDRFAKILSGEDYNITSTETHAGGRLAIWQSGLTLFMEHPILGVGPGTSEIAMGERFGNSSWKTMHNSFLQAALELGIPGIILYCLILKKIWSNCQKILSKKGREKKEPGVMLAAAIKTSLIGYTVAALFLSQAFSVFIPLALAISSRLSCAFPEESTKGKNQNSPRHYAYCHKNRPVDQIR